MLKFTRNAIFRPFRVSEGCKSSVQDQYWYMCRCFGDTVKSLSDELWGPFEDDLQRCLGDEEEPIDRQRLVKMLEAEFCHGALQNPCKKDAMGFYQLPLNIPPPRQEKPDPNKKGFLDSLEEVSLDF